MPKYSNTVIMGHLGKDVELRTSKSGMDIVTASVAVSDGTKDKPHTSWYNVVAFDWRGDQLARGTKGDSVLIIGQHKEEEWTTNEGEKRRSWKLVANYAELISHEKAAKQEPTAPVVDDDDDVPF